MSMSMSISHPVRPRFEIDTFLEADSARDGRGVVRRDSRLSPALAGGGCVVGPARLVFPPSPIPGGLVSHLTVCPYGRDHREDDE